MQPATEYLSQTTDGLEGQHWHFVNRLQSGINRPTAWRFVAIWSIIILSMVSQSQAGLIHSTTPDQAYLDYAAQIGGSTVFLERLNASGEFVFGATGIYIGDGWVLASAHQTLAIDNDLRSTYSGFRIGTGSNYLTNRGSLHDIVDVFVHPGYHGLGNGYDLAMFKMAAPLQGVASSNLHTGSIAVGMDAHITGFGLTGQIGVTFPAIADGNLRAGVNRINQVDFIPGADQNYFGAGIVGNPGSGNFRNLGYLLLSGDSGGGWFVEINGEFQLAGISSASNARADTHGYGFSSVATKLDIGWINDTKATAVPEPSVLLLLAGVLPVIVMSRKREWVNVWFCSANP